MARHLAFFVGEQVGSAGNTSGYGAPLVLCVLGLGFLSTVAMIIFVCADDPVSTPPRKNRPNTFATTAGGPGLDHVYYGVSGPAPHPHHPVPHHWHHGDGGGHPGGHHGGGGDHGGHHGGGGCGGGGGGSGC